MSRAYLRALENTFGRMLSAYAEIQEDHVNALFKCIAAMAGFSGTEAPRASSELANVVAILRDERQRQGLTMRDIQAASGISRTALSEIETQKNANPSIATLNRIAAALGMKLVVALVEADEPVCDNQETTAGEPDAK